MKGRKKKMKRKIIIGLVTGAVVFGGALAVGAVKNDDSSVNLKDQNAGQAMMTFEEAKEIALDKQDGFVESIELEGKSGKPYYEVEIKNGSEYEFKIDAVTGEVLSSTEKQDDDWGSDDWKGKNADNQNIIPAEEAIAIAEKEVNGKMKEIELEDEDRGLEYKIELRTDKGEAEVELDAATGKVLDVEYDD
jgi:uncharacterized membrane protein YkoI